MNRTRMRGRAAMRLVPVLGVGVVLVMASACGTPPASRSVRRTTVEGRSVAPQGDRGAARPRALSYLQEDYERIFPERLRLARYGEVRYAAGDQGDAGGDGDRSDKIEMSEAPSLVVVDQVRDRVRVIAPQDHYRLLLWIDVSDLYRVMTERVALVPDRPGAPAGPAPTGPAAEGGAAIRLRPGLAVEIDGEGRGMVHIKHRDQCVSFSGWVPRTAVGTQFVPVEATASQPSALVTAGTVVYERPGGREVARFMVDCEVVETGPESEGHRPISYTTEW